MEFILHPATTSAGLSFRSHPLGGIFLGFVPVDDLFPHYAGVISPLASGF
jgi:hypothetical protein